MNIWVEECWRLAACLAIAVLAGVISGFPALALIAALMLYAGWMIFRFYELHIWLENGAKTETTPDTVGLASTIVQLVHRERKRRQRQKEKLRGTLQQFNALASEIPDATVVLDDKLQIQWCNNAASTLLGLTRQRDTGQRIDNLIRLPEFHQYLLNPAATSELEMESPLGPSSTLLVTCVPAGNMSILTARDITQRVQVREMRKAFVADVSHELKTPLTVIQGHIEMLREEGLQQTGSSQLALRRVAEHTDRMATIVGDLLTLSKLESNTLAEDQGQPINIAMLLRGIVSDKHAATDHSHKIELQLDENLWLRGMESEIHSACQNLIDNAIAYTEPGTRIEVNWALSEPFGAVFSVKDYGPGIEPEHVPKLSQRFYRVDKDRSRESGGTGLGLAIVKYIAQRHGGQLQIESELGTSSTFSIQLPSSRCVGAGDQREVS